MTDEISFSQLLELRKEWREATYKEKLLTNYMITSLQVLRSEARYHGSK